MDIGLRQKEEIFKQYLALDSSCGHKLDPGPERDKRGRCSRGVDDRAAVVIENGVVASLSITHGRAMMKV